VYDDLNVPHERTRLLERINEVTAASTMQGLGGGLKLHTQSLMAMAASSIVSMASLPKCQFASPHTNIHVGYDATGNLRLECLHSPTHCWSLDGVKGRC